MTLGDSTELGEAARPDVDRSDPTRGPSVAPTHVGPPLVVLKDVDKYFGELHVLQHIDLTVGKGEVVVVLGPSGSGKSTLCRAINRLETIHSGNISIDGDQLPEEGKALARLRADVGMVFQSFKAPAPDPAPARAYECAVHHRDTPVDRW